VLQKRSIALPGSVTLVQVVDAAHAAARGFLALEPSKAALTEWLHGPYREATRFGPRRLVTPGAAHPDMRDTRAIVESAQEEVREAIRSAQRTPKAEDLVRRLPPVVHIVPAHDVSGKCGFIPIDAQGGRLADRVVALVLADYLTRPHHFIEHPLFEERRLSGERRALPDAPTLPRMPAVREK